MGEDRTHEFPQDSIGERILAELAAVRLELTTVRQEVTTVNSRLGTLEDRLGVVETRLGALEEKVDEGLRETRPIWESVQARLAGIESELKTLNRQFRSMMADMFQLRVRVETLEGEQPA